MRHRGAAARPALAALALLALPGALRAQDAVAQDAVVRHSTGPSQPTARLTVLGMLALASPLLTDGNGTRVRLAPAPLAGLRLTTGAVGGVVRPTATLRIGTSAVRLHAGAARWSAGQALQAELLAGAEWRPHPRATVRGTVGAVWIPGPRDVAPFAASRAPYPAAELGVTLRRRARSRTALELAAQGLRVSPRPGSAGGVLRVLLGLSHAL
ncbi:MAG TPA: hypothetical protein VF048_06115 [Gemmatimonadaceae bacterium]